MRSDSAPETRRLMMPQASMMDSICAPCAAPKPRSVQYATICTCGMAMATQQDRPATHSAAVAVFGDKSKGRSRWRSTLDGPVAASALGAAWRISRASKPMLQVQNSPTPM